MLVARPHQDSAGTTGMSFPSPLPSPWRRWASGTATSSPGAHNRTARSSAVIGLTTRSSGAVSDSTTSPRPLLASGPGKPDTTTSASPWRCRDGRRPKNSRACYRLRRHNAMAALAVAHRRPGVNLDETQQTGGTRQEPACSGSFRSGRRGKAAQKPAPDARQEVRASSSSRSRRISTGFSSTVRTPSSRR
jgi:hypothetical protein